MSGKIYLYLLVLAIVAVHVSCIALGESAESVGRSGYFLYHAGWLHLAANVMCLLAIARSAFSIRFRDVVSALAIAAVAPLSAGTTLGASGICYALLGIMSWQSCNMPKYHALITTFVALGLIMPSHVNVPLHAFCYIQGVLFGYIYICRK